MIAYKFLRPARRAPISQCVWPEPEGERPGAWVEAGAGAIDPGRHGVHACQVDDLAHWLAEELWEVELDGEITRGPNMLVAQRGRLLRPIVAWSQAGAGEFAAQCVARAERHAAQLAGAAATLARQYTEQARAFACDAKASVAAYAAALALSVAAHPELELALFQAERAAQAELLARILGL